jgi:acetyltransferase-like isoleucine patch superfamily enzyme
MKLLKNLVALIARLLTPIRKAWKLQEIEKLRKQITCHKSSIIFSTSSVINTRQQPSQIVVEANTWISGQLLVFYNGKIEIGKYCFFGEGSKIWAASQIKIGNRVFISHNVNIHDNNSHPIDAEERHIEFKERQVSGKFEDIDLKAKPILIEDDVWIGFNVTILKGVTIGRGAIIGACAVITKDVPPYTIVTSTFENNYRKI